MTREDTTPPARAVPSQAISVQPAAAGLCPLCRDDLEQPDEPRLRCPGCQVDYHQACWEELGGCSTMGCEQHSGSAAARLRALAPRRRRAWTRRRLREGARGQRWQTLDAAGRRAARRERFRAARRRQRGHSWIARRLDQHRSQEQGRSLGLPLGPFLALPLVLFVLYLVAQVSLTLAGILGFAVAASAMAHLNHHGGSGGGRGGVT